MSTEEQPADEQPPADESTPDVVKPKGESSVPERPPAPEPVATGDPTVPVIKPEHHTLRQYEVRHRTTYTYEEDVTDSVDTVAGLLSYELGRVPLPGSAIVHDGLRYTAEGGRDRRGRIKTRSVLIEVPEPAEAPMEDSDGGSEDK